MIGKKMVKQVEVSPKQYRVLLSIYNFQIKKPYSVTIAQVAKYLQVNKTTTFEHIAALREKGLIEKSTGKYRCLKLTKKGVSYIKKSEKLVKKSPMGQFDLPENQIVILGRVAAGKPIDYIEDKDTINISEKFGTQDVFALQVQGQSMIEDGILDGDYIICRKKTAVENGQLAVVMVNGETTTVKRFYKDKDAVRLKPANSEFEPIITQNCTVEAAVIGVIRKY